MSDKATIEDVAQKAGVAPSTVSLAINGKPNVSSETRKAVIEAAKELDYQPHSAAKSLATGQSETIGLLIPIELKSVFSSTEFFQNMISGMHRAAGEMGMTLSLQIVESEEEAIERIEYAARSDSVSGSVITHPTTAMPYLDVIRNYDYSVVFLGDPVENVPYVDNDNIDVSRVATEHLINHGHERIAMLSGPGKFTVSRNRLMGYRSALEEAGIPFREELVWESDLNEQSAYETVLANAPEKDFSAMYISVEVQGIGSLRALRELKLKVPDDVALVVVGESELAKHLASPLTTVDLNTERLGYLSAKKLIGIIKGKEEEPHLIVPADLKIRESCGCNETESKTGGEKQKFNSKKEQH
ncbi:MAG: LacI family DNA-binding transcriptional regulator [Candidatus Bipolaricaulota bacterium]